MTLGTYLGQVLLIYFFRDFANRFDRQKSKKVQCDMGLSEGYWVGCCSYPIWPSSAGKPLNHFELEAEMLLCQNLYFLTVLKSNTVKSLIEAPPRIEAHPALRPSLRFENGYQNNFQKFQKLLEYQVFN